MAHYASKSGDQEVTWNGRDRNDKILASGVYFYRVSAGDRAVTKKLVLLD